MDLITYIENIPKAELHVHIEGTLEAELLFELADRNNVDIPYKNITELREAYNFNNLQEFLDLYYAGAGVLKTKQDFYELTYDYLKKLNSQNVRHVEIMFDPQTHTHRGIELSVVFDGICEAMRDGERSFGISSKLILSFLRHLSEEEAIHLFNQALPFKDHFIAVGLDSSEKGNPPAKFERVFQIARAHDFICVAHAGEEGPASNVMDAIHLLGVSRIDHDNSSMDDPALIQLLLERQIPLTLCPLSNLSLNVIDSLEQHPLKTMLDMGLMVTLNSDDPAYFGGHLNDNFVLTSQALKLTKKDITLLATNSFKASFLDEAKKDHFIDLIGKYSQQEVFELS